MDHSRPDFPVHHQFPEFTQTHVHGVSDAIQPSHPLSSPSPPASETFPVSQLFAWGVQSTGVSALASLLPKKSQGWSPSECTGWISLQSKGLSRVFSNTTVQKHQFFGAQLFIFYYLLLLLFLLYNIILVLPYINMNPLPVYMCSPSWTPLPPPSPYHSSGSSQCSIPEHPVSCIEPGLAIHFPYDILHVSMPFSKIIPPSPSPSESKSPFYTSVSLLLSHIQGHHLNQF